MEEIFRLILSKLDTLNEGQRQVVVNLQEISARLFELEQDIEAKDKQTAELMEFRAQILEQLKLLGKQTD